MRQENTHFTIFTKKSSFCYCETSIIVYFEDIKCVTPYRKKDRL